MTQYLWSLLGYNTQEEDFDDWVEIGSKKKSQKLTESKQNEKSEQSKFILNEWYITFRQYWCDWLYTKQ